MNLKNSIYLQFTTLLTFVCIGQISRNFYNSDKPLNGRSGLEITTCYKPSKFNSVVNVLVRGASELYFLTSLNSLQMSQPNQPHGHRVPPPPPPVISDDMIYSEPMPLQGITPGELELLVQYFNTTLEWAELKDALRGIRDRYSLCYIQAMSNEDFATASHSAELMRTDLFYIDELLSI